jgi:hypothetical protein
MGGNCDRSRESNESEDSHGLPQPFAGDDVEEGQSKESTSEAEHQDVLHDILPNEHVGQTHTQG